jgi:hypothetical protein
MTGPNRSVSDCNKQTNDRSFETSIPVSPTKGSRLHSSSVDSSEEDRRASVGVWK